MSTRFLQKNSDPAVDWTGEHAGIGVNSTTNDLVVNADGIKRLVQPLGAGTEYPADGTIGNTVGLALLTKTSAGAYTLGVPTGLRDGTILNVRSKTAFAHVVTVTGGFGGTGGTRDVATFTAEVGTGFQAMAINSLWHLVSTNLVTVA